MRISLLSFIFIVFHLHLLAQSVTFSSTQPTNLYVCGPAGTFTVTLTNSSTGLVDNPRLTIKLPSGMEYVPGSVMNATEFDISDLDSVLVDLADISAGNSITVTFQAIVKCSALTLIENDIDISNSYRVDYVGGFDEYVSSVYDVNAPSLVFVSITNQTYTGLVGNTFARTITIKNSGNAPLSSFTLDDVHGSGIQVNTMSPGTFNNIGLTSRLQLGAAEFATVGNMNGLLDPNEQIVITQSITVLACTGLNSNYQMYWGCHSQTCATTIQNGNVVIQNGVPIITHAVTNSHNTCYGGSNISTQRLRISNTGTETARMLDINIYQGYGGGIAVNTYYSRIDTSNIRYKIGNNNPFQKLIPTSTTNNTNYPCFASSNAISAFTYILNFLQPGDTLYLEWDVYMCCQSVCNGTQNINGWEYQIKWKNQCLTNDYQTAKINGRGYSSMYLNGQTFMGPSDISDGQTNIYNVVNSGIGLYPSNTANDRVIVTLVFPPGIQWGGTLTLTNSALTPFPILSTYTSTGGDTVRKVFNYTLGLEKSEINFDIVGACGTAGIKNVQVITSFQPTSSCGCVFDLRCYNMPVKLHCPSACPAGGIEPLSFDFRRANYGQPDNNNDGVADGSGSLDFTKVKIYQAMVGDSLKGTHKAVVRAGTGGTTWDFVFIRDYIPEGGTNRGRIMPLIASARIYDASTATYYNIPNITSTRINLGNNCIIQHDLSASALIGAGLLPPGFLYEDGDSILVEYIYHITRNNIPGNLINITIADTFFASPVNNPNSLAQRFACDFYGANISLVGYYFTTWGPQNLNPSGCSNATLQQNYYYSVGPCCSNYAGGNLFPFEYRSGTYFKEFKVLLPTGYTFVSARINQIRGTGTATTNTSAWQTITPIDPNANPLVFNVAYLWEINGGPLPMPDDGYHGTFEVTVRGSCAVTEGVDQFITYTQKHEFVNHLIGTTYLVDSVTTSTHDKLLYAKPAFTLQSALPNVTTTLDSVYWDIQVTNITNITANNTWIYPQSVSGNVTVYRVVDLSTSNVINPVGGIYQLGNFTNGMIKNYRIFARYTNCNTDSLNIHLGWDCSGYPTSFAAYTCVTQKLTLKYTMVRPNAIMSVTPPTNPVNLCDTLDYEVVITNVNAGHGYVPYFTIRRPAGMFLVAGSAEIEYPIGSGFVSMGAPTVFGVNYIWKLDDIVAQLKTENGGLKGAPLAPNNAYKVRFKVYTTCSFVSGSKLRITSTLKGGCGTNYSNYFNLPIVTIAGTPSSYTSSFVTVVDTIKTCDGVTVNVRMNNLGPGATNGTDEIRVTIPSGIVYTPLSTNPIHNGPASEPTLVPMGADLEARWVIPAGVPLGDYVEFSFHITANPGLSSGDYDLDPYSVISTTLACGASSCNIFAITGSSTKHVTIDRPTGVWTGAVNTDWFNPANWSDCEIPICTKDVTIPNVMNLPIISTAQTAYSQSLLIQSNASVTLNATARLDICGDLTIQNNANLVSGNDAEVHFTGNSNQTFTNNGTVNFEKVFIEQTSTQNLVLNHDLIIDESLTLTNGRIVTGSNEVFVTNGTAASVNAGNTNSFVNGYLRRNISENGSYYLPVGNNTQGYELARIDFTNRGDVNQLHAHFRDWDAPIPTLNVAEWCGIYDCQALNHGYWRINANAYTTNPLYDIFLYNNGYTNACAGQTVMKSVAGAHSWNILDGYCDVASTAPLTIRRNMTGFSDFGVTQSNLPLPVEMLAFKAQPFNQSILLNWLVNSEYNLQGYEIQRSIDGVNFVKIGWNEAKNLNAPYNYEFIDDQVEFNIKYYYRLKVIDIDGSVRFSNTTEAIITEKPQFVVYPNPNKGIMNVMLELIHNENVKIQFLNSLGQVVWEDLKNFNKGIQKFQVETQLSKGIYNLVISTETYSYVQRIVIE